MNPLAWLVRRWPRPFGLEWVETEEFFATSDPLVFDLRPVRRLVADEMIPVGWTL